MTKVPRISPTTSRPIPIILGIALLVLILIGIAYYLLREGKHRSNPTDGHTSLVHPRHAA
jgi:hypothetical protein